MSINHETQTAHSQESEDSPSNIVFKSPQELEMDISIHNSKTSSPFISHPSSPIDQIQLNNLNLNSETLHNSTIDSSDHIPSFIHAKTPQVKNISPWRKFRSNNSTNIFNTPKQSILFNKPDLKFHSEQENKDIIKLTVENKCLRNFLRELVDKCDVDIHEYDDFLNSSPNKKDVELENLKLEYKEVFTLNQDLYNNLESVQTQLDGKVGEITQLRSYINNIEAKIDNLMIGKHSPNMNLDDKLDLLKSILNRPPTPPPSSIQQFIELEEKYNSQQLQKENIQKELQVQIQECLKMKSNFQIISSKFANLKSSIDENELKIQIETLKQSLLDRDQKIESLTQSLPNQKDQIDKLQNELNSSIEKERKYNTERIQLSYANEKLQKENNTLLQKLDTQLDSDSFKKLSILEYQYRDLLSFDISELNKLIKSYNKIADDSSLRDPKLKYEKLVNKIDQGLFQNITYIREKHKSIFEYFIRATDILIDDHIKLLLKENTTELAQLRNEVKRLNNENSQLQQASPISKLRLDDLRNKWKAEREKRIMEDKENKKRFRELELEIERLR